jgi:hypothetical protein
LQIRGAWSAGPGDDQARFLADLRALRDSAAIGYDELAARAHYPSDILKEAENGPSLPGLPILTAYVRACEGDVPDWEERWRRLNPDAADDPDLPVRPAGASPAAVAGARAGVSIAPPDVYDPERIKAALRGDHPRPEQAGRPAGDSGISVPVPGADPAEQEQHAQSGAARAASSGWDAVAHPGVTSANGSHLADHGGRGPFDAAFSGTSDPAERTEPAQAQEFSWLNKSTPEPRPAGDEPTWREPALRESAGPEPPVTEQAPWRQADGRTSPERTDFWSKPAASVASGPQRPGAPRADAPRADAPRADEPTIARASWSALADTAAEPAHQAMADTAALSGVSGVSGVSGSAQPHGPARSTSQTVAGDQDERRKDRLFPVRLLVVIVIAALIGSVLVLILK